MVIDMERMLKPRLRAVLDRVCPSMPRLDNARRSSMGPRRCDMGVKLRAGRDKCDMSLAAAVVTVADDAAPAIGMCVVDETCVPADSSLPVQADMTDMASDMMVKSSDDSSEQKRKATVAVILFDVGMYFDAAHTHETGMKFRKIPLYFCFRSTADGQWPTACGLQIQAHHGARGSAGGVKGFTANGHSAA